MAMDFDKFLLHCLRRRPADLDWLALVSHAALGLSSTSLALVGLLLAVDRPRVHDLVSVLGRFEYDRALLYFHADTRPVAVTHAGRESADVAVVDLACRAGRIGHLVEAWTGGSAQAYGALAAALDDLEIDRDRVYTALGIEPSVVWSRAQETPGPAPDTLAQGRC